MGKSRLNIGQKVEIRTEPDGEVYASMIQELEAETVAISLPVLQDGIFTAAWRTGYGRILLC